MIYLSELNGVAVPVYIHTSKDTTFKKKPVRSIELVFRLHNPPTPFLSHIQYFGRGFKICLTEPNDDNAAKIEFERKINELNTVMGHIAGGSFVHFVTAECGQFLENIESNLRGERDILKGAHEVKRLFSDSLVKHLRTNGIEASCNIGRGSLYLGDEVVINSGITQETTLSTGIIEFLGFKLSSYATNQYMAEYYKAPHGAYESGSWLNKLGDKPLVLSYSILVLNALKGFLERMSVLTGKIIEEDGFLSSAINNAHEQINLKQIELDKLIVLSKFDIHRLLADKRVRCSETYHELTLLGLGEAAKQEFAKKEGAMILLKELAEFLGADRVCVFNPQKVEEENDRYGRFDEFYGPHVTLPDQKTRKGMIAFKKQLDDPSSLACFLFEADKLKLNVSETASYDQEYDRVTDHKEMLDVCMGAKAPLAERGDVIRFVFCK
jgi:hypothetical protein